MSCLHPLGCLVGPGTCLPHPFITSCCNQFLLILIYYENIIIFNGSNNVKNLRQHWYKMLSLPFKAFDDLPNLECFQDHLWKLYELLTLSPYTDAFQLLSLCYGFSHCWKFTFSASLYFKVKAILRP